MVKPTKLYSKQYNSYCTWNGNAYENGGKVAGAYFYSLEKAINNGFLPIKTYFSIRVIEAENFEEALEKIGYEDFLEELPLCDMVLTIDELKEQLK